MNRIVRIAAASLVALGCAQERAPINRVQPDYFDKSFFVGQDYLNAADDPEFYSQATLIDVGYGAGQDGLFTSTYAQPMTRVRWSIQEDLLVARLAYERITGSDGKGAGKATEDGIVVAAFPITKHFDVQRTYNPATGEEMNVVEENSYDRPWYQRQYIRVDWSKNLSTDNYDFDTLSMLGVYGGVQYEPLAYFVNDPTAENAPHYNPDDGYLDITNKAFARPQLVDLSSLGGGTMPACMFDADIAGGTAPTTQCSPVELTIRQAFYKVKPNDYEPLDWDGYRFAAFGAFTTERSGYARNYGMTDTQWHRFINRYNLWDRNHAYADPKAMTGETACFTPQTTPVGADPHRDLNRDGTEDECAAVGSGSRCDAFKQRCTLPYRQRQVKTLAWYLASGSNQEFFEPTRDATHEWDVALRASIMAAQYEECVRTNSGNCANLYPVPFGQQEENEEAIALAKEVDDCRAGLAYAGEDCIAVADRLGQQRGLSAGVIALAKMPEALVLCHSPVEAKDNAACGSPRLPANVTAADCATARELNKGDLVKTCDAALTVRRGDVRYHQVNAITAPQTPSPWGIMVDANDPLTGETVSASINVWSHVTDLWSQGIVDTARYIRGEITTAEVTEGAYVRDWASAAEAASLKGSLEKLTNDQRLQMIADLSGGSVTQLESVATQIKSNPTLMSKLKAVAQSAQFVYADALAPSANRPVYEARRKHALNSKTEAQITTKMMQSLVGNNLTRLDNDSLMGQASPLRGANPSVQRLIRQQKELALAHQGACVMNEAPAPLAIADLTGILEAKFGKFDKTQGKQEQLDRAERMRKYLALRAHYAVITHEMGHSVGLRHNFVSSSDAYNYRPQYWQLRTDNGANTNACTQLDPTGSCVGPRYQDPINTNERNNLLTMWMNSSTMDYAGESTQDLLGLGAYDFAAAKMFYGEIVSVYQSPTYRSNAPRGIGALAKMDSFGGIVGFRPSIGNPTVGDPTNTDDIHYSQLQKNYELISGCRDVNTDLFKPARWDESVNGKWSPLVDGLIVSVNGKATKCHSQPVDYVAWTSMRAPQAGADVGSSRAGGAIDGQGRVRVPYGFATDRWADLGNLSVYRHDNGADPYELFDFLITQQEVNHIFDNYRRGRQTFTIRNAANRTLSRYNEKLRDAAKGLGLMANVYRDFALAQGYDYETLWPYISNQFFADNMLASGLGFDHFAKQMARPEAGPHYLGTQGAAKILRSSLDVAGAAPAGAAPVTIPNGATGYFGNVTAGGRPLENALATNKGEYNAEYNINAGMYYDKAYTAMLFTESVDNFISDSRRDFLDGRYRAVSLADLFPDGYRRWLATNLTGDDVMKGARLAAGTNGQPLKDAQGFPAQGIGYTRWWKPVPESCFNQAETILCSAQPTGTVALEPQVGWEQQKFLISWTLMYLPENAQQQWLNQLGIWEVGADSDPAFKNRIELHLPGGKVYVAQTFGTETILGKKVQKGVGARILEWGNTLLAQSYDVDNGPDLDLDGTPDWYTPKLTNGAVRVKYDPSIYAVADSGALSPTGRPGCNATDNSQCTCSSNKSCIELSHYEEIPFFMRQAMADYGLADPSMKGLH